MVRTKTAPTPAKDALIKLEKTDTKLAKSIECSVDNRGAIFSTGLAMGTGILGILYVMKDLKQI